MHDASFMHEIKMMDDVQRLLRQTQRPFKFVRACRRHAGLEPTSEFSRIMKLHLELVFTSLNR